MVVKKTRTVTGHPQDELVVEEMESVEREERNVVTMDAPKVQERKIFRATLTEANTYTFMGITFRRGIAQDIPGEYYEAFKANGWFFVQ